MSSTILHPSRSIELARYRVATQLSWHERAALGLGIFEIPLQLDKYLMFRESDSLLGAVAGFNVSITTICLVYLYGVWFFGTALHRRTETGSFYWGLPLIIYILAVVLSLFTAAVPVLAMFDIFLLAQAYALFFYCANRIKTYDDLVFSILMLAAMMTMQGVIIIGLGALGSSAHGEEFRFGPMVFEVWPDGRVAGTVKSAVVAGSLMAILWLPVFALNLSSRTRNVLIMTAISLAIGIIGLLLTQTRGAVLTVGIGIFLIGFAMFMRGWLPKWALGLALAMAIIGAYPLLMIIQNRVIGDDDGSAASRKHLSLIALETISHQPIFGYGAGNCHLACAPFANSGTYRSEWYYTIHCKYLVVWVETGIIGLVAFLLVLGNGIRHGLAAWARRDPLRSPLGLACAAAIAGHMVHMFVDIFNSRPQVQTLWLVLGITAAVYQQANLTLSMPSSRARGKSYVS